MYETCDRCGPAVQARYRADRLGELFLCAHCAMRPEWSAPLQDSITKFLTRTGHPAEQITPNAVQNAPLSDWRDWTTPTLN